MKTFSRLLLQNAHLPSLVISCGSVLFGLCAAVIRGGISIFPAFMTMLFAAFLQISANLYNGANDLSKMLKENVGYRTLIHEQQGLDKEHVLLLRTVSNGVGILAATAGLPLFTFIGWIGVLYLAVILIVMYFYFSGPRPIVNTRYSLLVTFFVFGPLTVSGTAMIQDFDNPEWWTVIVYSVLSGLMACNAHISIQYLRLHEDLGRGKSTLVISSGFKTAKYLYIFNSLAIAVIVNLRPCLAEFVDHWVVLAFGLALLGSSITVARYMGRHSTQHANKIIAITRGQYITFIIILTIIVVSSFESYKINLLHLV